MSRWGLWPLVFCVLLFEHMVLASDDCIMSEWGEWEPCSKTCGKGMTTRERKIEEEASDGRACPAVGEMAFCNTQACPNPDLIKLTLSTGSLDPKFKSNVLSYSVVVGTESLTMTPTAADPLAEIKIQKTILKSGQSSPFQLAFGINVFTIVVTSGDLTKTYTVSVRRDCADLEKLTLSHGTLDPSFSSGNLAYRAIVVVEKVSVTATSADPKASIKIAGVVVQSGKASNEIQLVLGKNDIKVEVSSGEASRIYMIEIKRASADLEKLLLSQGTIDPAFSSSVTSYKTVVSSESLTFTPFCVDSSANVKVNGVAVGCGKETSSFTLTTGKNSFRVDVAAGSISKTYNVDVTRESAELTGLILSEGQLKPAFSSSVTTYSSYVDKDGVTMTVTCLDKSSTLKIKGVQAECGKESKKLSLELGANLIPVVVSVGKSSKEYQVTVYRESAELKDLKLSQGILDPSFSSQTTSYSSSVDSKSIALTAICFDPSANLKINDVSATCGSPSKEFDLSLDSNNFDILVTSGFAKKKYTLEVTRESAELKDLAISQGKLDPSFASNQKLYNTIVNTEYVHVTPTCVHPSASITVNGVGGYCGYASKDQQLKLGSNLIHVLVTQGKSQASYNLTVTRESAELVDLKLEKASLYPTFSSSALSYSTHHTSENLDITATAADPTATIKINKLAATSGKPLTIPLSLGDNNVVVDVSTKSYSQSYNVKVIRETADLEGILLSSGELSPKFKSSQVDYIAHVTVSSITLTPKCSDPTSTVTVNYQTVVCGSASQSIELEPGNNTITTRVTSSGGLITNTYNVIVSREAPELQSLYLSHGDLSPTFTSDVTSYSTNVEEESVTITARTLDPNAKLKINGIDAASGYPSSPIPLKLGKNDIPVDVIVGHSSKKYIVTVQHDNAHLKNITLSNGSFGSEFISREFSYDAHVTDEKLAVTPECVDPNAVVKINNVVVPCGSSSEEIPLAPGQNKINVEVAVGKSIKAYSVGINRGIDCVVGEWGEWSKCGGLSCSKTRARPILTSPQYGGVECPLVEETKYCSALSCPGWCNRVCTSDPYIFWTLVGLALLLALLALLSLLSTCCRRKPKKIDRETGTEDLWPPFQAFVEPLDKSLPAPVGFAPKSPTYSQETQVHIRKDSREETSQTDLWKDPANTNVAPQTTQPIDPSTTIRLRHMEDAPQSSATQDPYLTKFETKELSREAPTDLGSYGSAIPSSSVTYKTVGQAPDYQVSSLQGAPDVITGGGAGSGGWSGPYGGATSPDLGFGSSYGQMAQIPDHSSAQLRASPFKPIDQYTSRGTSPATYIGTVQYTPPDDAREMVLKEVPLAPGEHGSRWEVVRSVNGPPSGTIVFIPETNSTYTTTTRASPANVTTSPYDLLDSPRRFTSSILPLSGQSSPRLSVSPPSNIAVGNGTLKVKVIGATNLKEPSSIDSAVRTMAVLTMGDKHFETTPKVHPVWCEEFTLSVPMSSTGIPDVTSPTLTLKAEVFEKSDGKEGTARSLGYSTVNLSGLLRGVKQRQAVPVGQGQVLLELLPDFNTTPSNDLLSSSPIHHSPTHQSPSSYLVDNGYVAHGSASRSPTSSPSPNRYPSTYTTYKTTSPQYVPVPLVETSEYTYTRFTRTDDGSTSPVPPSPNRPTFPVISSPYRILPATSATSPISHSPARSAPSTPRFTVAKPYESPSYSGLAHQSHQGRLVVNFVKVVSIGRHEPVPSEVWLVLRVFDQPVTTPAKKLGVMLIWEDEFNFNVLFPIQHPLEIELHGHVDGRNVSLGKGTIHLHTLEVGQTQRNFVTLSNDISVHVQVLLMSPNGSQWSPSPSHSRTYLSTDIPLSQESLLPRSTQQKRSHSAGATTRTPTSRIGNNDTDSRDYSITWSSPHTDSGSRIPSSSIPSPSWRAIQP